MVPLRLISRFFLFVEDEIPAELRAQRSINQIIVPEIANYILESQKDYVFSSLTASIDGEVTF